MGELGSMGLGSLIEAKPCFSIGRSLVPPLPTGTLIDVLGCFHLSQLVIEMLLVSSEERPRMLLNILQCTGQPPPQRII